MQDNGKSALLVLDFQAGVGDQPFAQSATARAAEALATARRTNLTIAFTKIDFLTGAADVSPRNRVFEEIKEKNLIPPGSSKIVSALEPLASEVVLNKDRYSAFADNSMHGLLRGRGIEHLVLAGLETSGVVLATFIEAVDLDYSVTILADACADRAVALQEQLITTLFPRSADVVNVSNWIDSLGA